MARVIRCTRTQSDISKGVSILEYEFEMPGYGSVHCILEFKELKITKRHSRGELLEKKFNRDILVALGPILFRFQAIIFLSAPVCAVASS